MGLELELEFLQNMGRRIYVILQCTQFSKEILVILQHEQFSKESKLGHKSVVINLRNKLM
jgi:hypothetical protein